MLTDWMHTGTFCWLTGTPGQSLQTGTVPAKTRRMVCLTMDRFKPGMILQIGPHLILRETWLFKHHLSLSTIQNAPVEQILCVFEDTSLHTSAELESNNKILIGNRFNITLRIVSRTTCKRSLWKEVLSQQKIRHFEILLSIYFAYDVGIISSAKCMKYKQNKIKQNPQTVKLPIKKI